MSTAAASMTSILKAKEKKGKLEWAIEYDLKFFLQDLLKNKKLTPHQLTVKKLIESILEKGHNVDPKMIHELEQNSVKIIKKKVVSSEVIHIEDVTIEKWDQIWLLAFCYCYGIGIERDFEKASALWFSVAKDSFWKSGHAWSQTFWGAPQYGKLLKGREYLLLAAKQGNACAENYLGLFECNNENFKEAKKHLLTAIKLGYIVAQYNYAVLLINWNNARSDYDSTDKSIDWSDFPHDDHGKIDSFIKLAADEGYPPAIEYQAKKIFEEGVEYETVADNGNYVGEGLGGISFVKKPNPKKAYECYHLAAKKGNPDAIKKISEIFKGFEKKLQEHLNDPTSKEVKEAIEYFEFAANDGFSQAQYKLGCCYRDGTGVKKDPKRAVEFFRQAALQDHSDAQNSLGDCYANGFGVSKEPVQAFLLYRQAADNSNAVALNNCGNCYEQGFGTAKDEKRAFESYRLAADKLPEAEKNLAVCYEKGIGIPKNLNSAYKHNKEAANKGNIKAKENLERLLLENPSLLLQDKDADTLLEMGLQYYRGATELKILKDLPKAIECFQVSSDKGCLRAQMILSECYLKGDGVTQSFTKGLELLQGVADKGEMEAQYMLSNWYEKGVMGVSKDSKKANELLRRSASSDYKPALLKMEIQSFLSSNKDIVTESETRNYKTYSDSAAGPNWAIKRIKILMNHKQFMAHYVFGMMTFHGLYGLEKNKSIACGYFIEAANQDLDVAQHMLAKCYLWGEGVQKDPEKAAEYFQLAAKHGHPEASSILACMLMTGMDGVPQNESRAVELFRKAASRGEGTARRALESLQPTLESRYQQGLNYFNNTTAMKDNAKAFDCFLYAANLGHAEAQSYVGLCYEQALGVERNDAKSAEYYFLAANSYEYGIGESKDLKKASLYYEKAAAAKRNLQKLLEESSTLSTVKMAAQATSKSDVDSKQTNEVNTTLALKTKSVPIFKTASPEQMSASANTSSTSTKQTEVLDPKVKAEQEYLLGDKFYYGKGVSQNYEEAFHHLRIAAELGNYWAQDLLGTSYCNGVGVNKNPIEGIKYFEQAVKQGYEQSACNLGVACLQGVGGTKDEKRAAELFALAASKKYGPGEYYLGFCYKNGRGVSINLIRAVELFHLSANKESSRQKEAEYQLGLCYEEGHGVTKDLKKAYQYYKLAADQKHQKAISQIEKLLKEEPSLALPDPLNALKTTSGDQATQASFVASPAETSVKPKYSCNDKSKVSDIKENDDSKRIKASSVSSQLILCDSDTSKERAAGTLMGNAAQNSIVFGSEYNQFLVELKTLGIMVETIRVVQTQIQQLSTQQMLLANDMDLYTKWLKVFLPKLNLLDEQLDLAQKLLANNPQVMTEQAYINNNPKLKAYQKRAQQELCRFITCYYLAPAGIFKLEGNKVDSVISAMGSIPIAGSFIQPLTVILSYANKKYRFKQMNRLAEIFVDTTQIAQVCCQFAREITLAREQDIQQLVEIEYSGWRKILGLFAEAKVAIEQQWNNLTTSDGTGLILLASEKRAVLDVAYLLQQILSGDVKVSKEQELSNQFMIILTGKPYQVRILATIDNVAVTRPVLHNTTVAPFSMSNALSPNSTTASISNSSTWTVPASPNSTASSVSPLAIEKMHKKIQLLEEQAKLEKEQAKQREEAMQRELKKQREEQEKLKEGLKGMGVNVDGGNAVQMLEAPLKSPNKEETAQITYLLERDRENAHRIRQLEIETSIAKETAVTKETVTILVKQSMSQANK